MSSRDLWTSRLGFILASAGAAVGLGAIWKFPYMAGTNGGSAFIIPYILFCFTLGMFLLLAEMVVGRAGRAASINSMIRVGKAKFWGIFGTVGIATGFLILTFYSTIGGWCVAYAVDAMMGNGLITDLSQLGSHFNSFASDPVLGIFYQVVFMLMTAGVVVFGVQAGIERLAKYLMPTLFILMIILIIRGLTLPGAWQGVDFMFSFNWEQFNADSLFNAMGFCFFSLSLGAGTMITYGTYLNPKADLPSSVGWVAFLGIMSSILGGLMVMPSVFAFHLDPSAGPGLTFVTMPAVFAQMPFGQLFAVFFYICLMVAALTSSVSMLEACTALLTQTFMVKRNTAIVVTTVLAALVGLAATLSFGAWSDVLFFGKNVFDLLDYVTSNVGMPLSTFGIAIAAAWVAWKTTAKELQSARTLSPATLTTVRILIGIVSPLFVLVVAAGGLGLF